MQIQQYQLFIDGKWQNPVGNQWFDSVNPYTNQVWARIPRAQGEDVEKACKAAHAAFPEWAAMHPSKRGELLCKLADKLAEKAKYLAEIEVQDNGKLFSEMNGQTNYIPQFYRYYAGLADKVMGNVIPTDKPNYLVYTQYEPLGVVVAITAWNSPLMLATWKIAPALAAGNTVIIKPSEFASASAFELAKIAEEVGFPAGVINVVSGYGNEAGQLLIEHPLVAKISFTGGATTGATVYANGAKQLKHIALELGGKSPNIVFADADIDNAVKGVISGIFAATGQTCIAGSRLLVEESIHDEFVAKLVDVAKNAKIGDPMDSTTNIGPITTPGQYEKVLNYIDIAKREGATCVLGGKAATGCECGPSPWFIEPTIFTNVTNNMRIAQEEVFGPVLAVIKFKDAEEAVMIANNIQFGLAAGVWTQDIKKAIIIPKKIKAGTVWVNTYRAISYMVPFGGYKHSGIGRENGYDAIFDYLQVKSTWISLEETVQNPFVMR